MSAGKEAARDLRYGRRGGRWAPSTPPPAWDGTRTNDATGEYGDKKCTYRARPDADPCGQPYRDHTGPCPLCGRDQLHHVDGDLEQETQAAARMATARAAAGMPLSKLDQWALAEWGDRPLGRVGEEVAHG